MATAYFDCFAGAAGDMIVAALVDAGANLENIRVGLARLDLHGYDVRVERVHRSAIAAVRFVVDVPHEHHHRGLNDILELIHQADLPERVTNRAVRAFTRLGQAEAKVHGVGVDEVHFHEVGAVDSIVDIVGACLALEDLGVDRIVSGPMTLGTGTVTCAHGTFPVPAPATAALVAGAPVRGTDLPGERTTPTGAALLTTLADAYGPLPEMTPSAIGYGAGTREDGDTPNVLRVVLGTEADAGAADTIVELSANLDDCPGEWIASAIKALLEAGCLDAWATPAVMKKSRPAWILSALCDEAHARAAEDILLRETTTFGVRRRSCHRRKLTRDFVNVETPYGPVRVKLGRDGEEILTAAPEHADCAAAAQSHHVPVREVYLAAQLAWRAGASE